jgi:ribonuclease BN (tRNA processing enzyme)
MIPLDHNDITVTILGSGTCVPSLKRSSCSVLVQIGGQQLLFDAGQGTIRRLLEAGITIFEISYIFFSHFHPDHTGELVPFLFSTKYYDKEERKKPLVIAGGKGFASFYSGLKAVYGRWIELDEEILKIIEFDNDVRDMHQFNNFTIETIPVQHNQESIAYRIISPAGTVIVYSGDTDFSLNLVDLAQNADLLICEASFPDSKKAKGHLTPSLAGAIASKANVNQLVLTHLYPICDEYDIEKECRKNYNG